MEETPETPIPPVPPSPPVETTVKPVSAATTINAISLLQALVGFVLAFLGVVQASSAVFGSEYAGIVMVLVGATMAGLQSLSSWINSQSSNKTQA